MLTILVLALAQVASAAQSLTVNGQPVDSITLEVDQSCTVEVEARLVKLEAMIVQ